LIFSCAKTLRAASLLAVFSLSAFSAEITGTVINKTVDKPAGGDDVILLKLAQGMQEVARTKTDSQGRFRLSPPPGDQGGSGIGFLIRVNHKNVNYHRPAPPGTTSVEISVYDPAEKIEGMNESVDIMRMEADATNLRVVEMFAISNNSKPPRTLVNAKSFEMVLPEGAQVEQSLAAGPGGMPINTSPIPTSEKNHYAFVYPLRPGETRFQISYTLPYSGTATIRPVILRPTENFAVSAPKSMRVIPTSGSNLVPKGEDAGMAVYVAQNAKPGDPVSFTVSGTGSSPMDNTGAQEAEGGAASGPPKPGGGLGVPTNTPDPLYKYRWWLMGVVAAALVGGAAFTLSRPAASEPAAATAGGRRGSMLDTLKDELFQLETERLEQKISSAEYASAKAALDLLMQRALKRKQL